MKNIVRFNSKKEFLLYIKSQSTKILGSGSEGTCYLGRDGLAYKELITGVSNEFIKETYVLEDIITTSDVSNDSFAFPCVLFSVEDKLVGYTSKLITPNLFDTEFIVMNGLDHIDFNKLIKAYYVMKEDVIKLSKQGIKIYDLTCNLIFDGKKLVGIDTCSYYKTDKDVTEKNIYCLENAIKDPFKQYALFDCDEEIDIDRTMDVESFLRMVESKYTTKKKKIRRKSK